MQSGKSFFSEKELALIKALVKHKVEFMLVGLSAAALQGAAVVTQDIDLWIKDLNADNYRAALKSVGAIYVAPWGQNPPVIGGEGFRLFDLVIDMSGLGSFDEEKKHCIFLPFEKISVPVLDLKRIIVSKTAANREKDRLVLKLLRDTLETKAALK